MDNEPKDHLILGRRFLATAGAIINVKKGMIDMNLGNETIRFNVNKMAKNPTIEGDVFSIEDIDDLVDDRCEDVALVIKCFDNWSMPSEDNMAIGAEEEETSSNPPRQFKKLDGLDLDACAEPPLDIQEEATDWDETRAPQLELKPLPKGLRYAHLGKNATYPVIVNAYLSKRDTELLLTKLRKFKKAIGYSLDDIKGISPSPCMHRIYLEDKNKSSVEHQRYLNPNLQEVVKKEITKLLKAGIIYSISDSS